MTNEAREFLRREYDSLHKVAYESHFTHFMAVFYFWIAVVTFPATAGLIAGNKNLPDCKFGLLLALLSILGVLLSAKMFDIRCSQLMYIKEINEVRYQLHAEVKSDIPTDFKLPFGRDRNLRHVARTDFGIYMAVVMSLVNGAYAFYAAKLLGCTLRGTIFWGFVAAMVCLGSYFLLVLCKVPEPTCSSNLPMQPTGAADG